MATPAQAAATTVGAGSLAAAGAYGITQAVKGNEESLAELPSELAEKVLEPESKKLTEATSQTYSQNTLGHKPDNKALLVDFKNSFNEPWWKWAYENLFLKFKSSNPNSLNDVFKTVDKPYDPFVESQPSTPAKTSLNYACHKAYELKWYDFTSENHLLKNVKQFCSPLLTTVNLQEPNEQKPTNVKYIKDTINTDCDKDTNYKDKLACKNSKNNKDHLVAPVGKDGVTNEDWWKWSYKKHFLAKKGKAGQIHSDFISVTSAYSSQAAYSSPQTALNQVCDAAYKKSDNISDPIFQSNVKEFCGKDSGSSSITFS